MPRNEDELELKEGDVVDVIEKCDDGWFVGMSFIKLLQHLCRWYIISINKTCLNAFLMNFIFIKESWKKK